MNSSYSAQVEPIQRPRCAITSTAVHRSGVDFCLNASRVGWRFAPECATASMFCTVLPVAAENCVRASHRGRRAFANELYVHQRDGHDWHAKVRLTGRSRLSNVTPSARTNGASWPVAACRPSAARPPTLLCRSDQRHHNDRSRDATVTELRHYARKSASSSSVYTSCPPRARKSHVTGTVLGAENVPLGDAGTVAAIKNLDSTVSGEASVRLERGGVTLPQLFCRLRAIR